jgi:hypothetical protein
VFELRTITIESSALRIPFNSQGTIGCIDGTHVPVKVPDELKREYWNYKGFTSVIVLGKKISAKVHKSYNNGQ